ncbi:hypothetical protein [Ancylomarina longa]|uniref:Molybdopterin-guanine dinucleotide biosynthesis protein B (MobB) domain-containing protein n=1 Tax=Ancylomarina longa TaxID=2487017 RepID=A0A434AWP8_9BACT|nr:hypothetical protein [Ancylomarina longa]RUT78931.1 hypothetical protein DLK05_05465 [Ancylomarina longa]
MEEIRKNILLIAGTGRNVGKTLLACKIIAHLKQSYPIVSIKISPHFHELNTEILKQNNNFQIAEEKELNGSKDSNRLLRAGSKRVFYVQTKDEFLGEVLHFFDSTIPKGSALIIESGGLGEIIQPGLFLVLNKKNNKNIKPRAIRYKQIADKWIEFDGKEFNATYQNISFKNQEWVITKQTT